MEILRSISYQDLNPLNELYQTCDQLKFLIHDNNNPDIFTPKLLENSVDLLGFQLSQSLLLKEQKQEELEISSSIGELNQLISSLTPTFKFPLEDMEELKLFEQQGGEHDDQKESDNKELNENRWLLREYGSKRTPSWTDRILIKNIQLSSLKNQNNLNQENVIIFNFKYYACKNILISDHEPVVGIIEVCCIDHHFLCVYLGISWPSLMKNLKVLFTTFPTTHNIGE